MDRYTAHKLCRDELDKNGLSHWGVRLTTSEKDKSFLGLCSFKDECIILNAFHIDIHPDDEIIDTIKHEVAHALTMGHGHDNVWADKARELGCSNTLPCSHLGLPEEVIDAIRSGQMIEMTVEETTHVVRTPKYTITRLQDKCPTCHKVAIEKFRIQTLDKDGNDVTLITLECFHIIKKIKPRGTPFEVMISNGWKPEVADCVHEFPKSKDERSEWPMNQCYKCGEFKLLPFQIVGAQALEAGASQQKGFGLFDDMGLGKTVQALSYIKFHSKEACPVLYIVKSGIKFQFFKEIVRWLGPEFLGQIISTSKDHIFPGLKTYIVSFDLLGRIPSEKLAALKIKTVVIDECQQIKNPDAARTQAVRRIVGQNECKVIPISGTPWKNRGSEFFSVLNMMDPIKFHSYQAFLDNHVEFYWEGSKRKMGGIKNVKRFRELTSNLLIRREYNEVMDERPEVNRMKLNVKLDDLSQSTYDDEVSDFVKWYNDAVIGGEEESLNSLEILAKLSRMRHITGLAKIPATVGFIEEFIENDGKKLVVFVHHKDVGHLLISELTGDSALSVDLKKQGYQIMKLTAEFSDVERFTIAEEFNKHDKVIMIASTLASGEGINLQTCHDCIMHERQWNPQNEDQAAPGRFRRIGQLSKNIDITFVEAEETVDEHLDSIVSAKRRQFHDAMNKGEQPVWIESDIIKQLAETIVSKHKGKNKGTQITQMTQYSGAR